MAARVLGRACALRRDELMVDALAEMAKAEGGKAEDLVAEAARLQGLPAKGWDADVRHLAHAHRRNGGRVVLSEAAHGAYKRVVDRILGVLHAGDSLAPCCTGVTERERGGGGWPLQPRLY